MKKVTRRHMSGMKTGVTGNEPSSQLAGADAGSSSSLSTKKAWVSRIRDKLPALEDNEYEVLWERGVLGVIFLESESDGIPYVSKATETCISSAVSPGDVLKYVNAVCSKDHSFSDFFKILATMKKPVLLRFEKMKEDIKDFEQNETKVSRVSGRSKSTNNLSVVSNRDVIRKEQTQEEETLDVMKTSRSNSLPQSKDTLQQVRSARSAFWNTMTKSYSATPHAQNLAPTETKNTSEHTFKSHELHRKASNEKDDVHKVNIQNREFRSPSAYEAPKETASFESDYEVEWRSGTLGIYFGEHRTTHLPVITRASAGVDPLIRSKIDSGDLLLQANDMLAQNYTFEEFFSRLQQIEKPVRLRFRRMVHAIDNSRHSAGPTMITKLLQVTSDDNIQSGTPESEKTAIVKNKSGNAAKQPDSENDFTPNSKKTSSDHQIHKGTNGDVLQVPTHGNAQNQNEATAQTNGIRSEQQESEGSMEHWTSNYDSAIENGQSLSEGHDKDLESLAAENFEYEYNLASVSQESDIFVSSQVSVEDVSDIDNMNQILSSASHSSQETDEEDEEEEESIDGDVEHDPDFCADMDTTAVMPPAVITSKSLTKSPFAGMANVSTSLAKYNRKSKSARDSKKLPAISEKLAQTVPLVAPHAVNTSIQVRGRSKPKVSSADTPDSATFLVKWKESCSVGFQLREVRLARGIFPLIIGICRQSCCEILRHVCIGDVILEINGKDTSTMGVKKTATFLRTCTKTALIKLRHGPCFVAERVSARV